MCALHASSRQGTVMACLQNPRSPFGAAGRRTSKYRKMMQGAVIVLILALIVSSTNLLFSIVGNTHPSSVVFVSEITKLCVSSVGLFWKEPSAIWRSAKNGASVYVVIAVAAYYVQNIVVIRARNLLTPIEFAVGIQAKPATAALTEFLIVGASFGPADLEAIVTLISLSAAFTLANGAGLDGVNLGGWVVMSIGMFLSSANGALVQKIFKKSGGLLDVNLRLSLPSATLSLLLRTVMSEPPVTQADAVGGAALGLGGIVVSYSLQQVGNTGRSVSGVFATLLTFLASPSHSNPLRALLVLPLALTGYRITQMRS